MRWSNLAYHIKTCTLITYQYLSVFRFTFGQFCFPNRPICFPILKTQTYSFSLFFAFFGPNQLTKMAIDGKLIQFVKACWVYLSFPCMLQPYLGKMQFSKNICHFFGKKINIFKTISTFELHFLRPICIELLCLSALHKRMKDSKLDKIYLRKIAVEILGL